MQQWKCRKNYEVRLNNETMKLQKELQGKIKQWNNEATERTTR